MRNRKIERVARELNSKETHAAIDSANFGIGLVTSSLKELFRSKKDDEDWNEFLLVKAGLILMIMIGLGIFVAILFYAYLRFKTHF
jgi:hypothetical protein